MFILSKLIAHGVFITTNVTDYCNDLGIKDQIYLVSVLRLLTIIQNTRVVLPILYCQLKCQGQIYTKPGCLTSNANFSYRCLGRLFLFDALFTGGQMFWIASMTFETKFKAKNAKLCGI